MTVTLYHLCASMRAHVRACVCGGGFLDGYSTASRRQLQRGSGIVGGGVGGGEV